MPYLAHVPISDLLTTQQAAEVLGISRRTLTRWVEDGKVPVAHRLPGETGAFLFDPKEIARHATKAAS